MFVDFKCRHGNTSKRLLQPLTCVAGVQRGRRGKLNSTAKRDRWNLEGNTCKDAIVFFVFLRPVDERKNADWSELIRSTYKPLFCFVRYMSFNYSCHLSAHVGSKEVIAFSKFFKKHALKYELDL